MNYLSFYDYLETNFSSRNSGTVRSYIQAIKIVDELFKKRDIFNMNNVSIKTINGSVKINQIYNYIKEEENKYKRNEPSIFDLGKTTQTSYPKSGFCSAAIRQLEKFILTKSN